MPKYLIEREIVNTGRLTKDDLRQVSQILCDVLSVMGTGIQWVHSYVTDHKIYCIYLAVNEEQLRHHARKSGLPANRILRISSIIDPATGENREI
jgi:hypothetical protein